MADWLWFIITAVVMIGMLVAAFMIEPHWSSKDGQRFICRAQPITIGRDMGAGAGTGSRWREVRGELSDDGIVKLRTRGLISGRRITGDWRIHARGSSDRRKRLVFLLRSADSIGNADGAAGETLLALRMPRSSRSAPLLERLVP